MERTTIYGLYHKITNTYFAYFKTEESILKYMENYVDNANLFFNNNIIFNKDKKTIFTIHPIIVHD